MAQTVTETYVRDVNNDAEEEEEEDTSVEIQRSFLIPADCDARLKPYGARLLADQVFVDEFYDRGDYALSLQDITLRSRDGEWDLSYREGKGEGFQQSLRVLRGPEEISAFLHSKQFLNGRAAGQNIQEVLKSAGFSVFASPSVQRKVYGIPAVGGDDLLPAKISVDASDFGYSVGEIEVSADDQSEISAALRTIEVLAQRLGMIDVNKGNTGSRTHGFGVQMTGHAHSLGVQPPPEMVWTPSGKRDSNRFLWTECWLRSFNFINALVFCAVVDNGEIFHILWRWSIDWFPVRGGTSKIAGAHL